MTEDDKLIAQFFSENPIEIEDNGFTERVMQNLPVLETKPSRALRLSRIWTAFCVVVAVAFFIAIKGWNVLATAFTNIFSQFSMSSLSDIHIDSHTILMYALGVFTLCIVGAYNVVADAK